MIDQKVYFLLDLFSLVLLFQLDLVRFRYFSLKLNDETYTFASRWLVGNVWGRDWIHVLALLPWIFILTPYAWLKSKTLNALSLGDSVAAGLGVSVQKNGYYF